MSAALIVGMETTSWRGPEPPIRSAKLGFQASIFQLPKRQARFGLFFFGLVPFLAWFYRDTERTPVMLLFFVGGLPLFWRMGLAPWGFPLKPTQKCSLCLKKSAEPARRRFRAFVSGAKEPAMDARWGGWGETQPRGGGSFTYCQAHPPEKVNGLSLKKEAQKPLWPQKERHPYFPSSQ